MKIAGASQGSGGLDDVVSPVIARCPVQTLVTAAEQEINGAETITNPATDQPPGAGIQAAQQLINQGAGVVIAGNFGPPCDRGAVTGGGDHDPRRIGDCPAGGGKVPGWGDRGRAAARNGPPPGTMPAWTPGAGRGRGGGRGMGRGRQFAPPGVQPGQGPWICPARGYTMPPGKRNVAKMPELRRGYELNTVIFSFWGPAGG